MLCNQFQSAHFVLFRNVRLRRSYTTVQIYSIKSSGNSVPWYINIFSSTWRGPRENVSCDFVLTSPAVYWMSCLSYLYGFSDGRSVTVQLLFCGMLLPGLIQYGSSNSCTIAVKLFRSALSQRLCVVYWPSNRPNMPFQRCGCCIFHWRRRAWLTIWDKVKSRSTVKDAPEESDLWTAWQLFPLDDDQTCHSKDSEWAIELLYKSVKTGNQLVLETRTVGDKMR